MTVQMNDRAVALLGALGDSGACGREELAPALRQRLDGGLVLHNSAVVLAETARTAVWPGKATSSDLTGWECGVNSFHLDDFVEVPVGLLEDGEPVIDENDQRELLMQGLILAREVCGLAQSAAPSIPLRCIVGANSTNAVFRFHRLRAGERWHNPNLDAYLEEHLIVVDCGPFADRWREPDSPPPIG